MRFEKWRSWAPRLLGTLVLIAALLWFAPFSDVLRALRSVQFGYFAAGTAVIAIGWFIAAFQLSLLLRSQGGSLGTWKVFEINMISRFYGQFLPGELSGGAVKLYRLARPTNQWGEALAAIAFSRVVDLLTLIALGICFWLLEAPSGSGRIAGLAMVGMAGALILAHFALSSRTVWDYLQRVLPISAVARLRGKLIERGRSLVVTTVDGYRLLRGHTAYIAGLSVLRHLFGILSFKCFALSIDVDLSFVTIGWIRVVLQVLMMLPISISGFGVREGSLVVLLQEYGVPPSQAVALGLLLFARNLISNALGGLFEVRNLLFPKRVDLGAERKSE